MDRLGGPSRVAEMTGRKGRLIRRLYVDGEDGFVYDLRDDGKSSGGGLQADALESVNIKERQAFMQG